LWSPGRGESSTHAGFIPQAPALASRFVYFAPQFGLLLLLGAEILHLTITFDSDTLLNATSVWARVVGWAPETLRLAIAILAATFLFTGSQLWSFFQNGELINRRQSTFYYLFAQLFTFFVFFRITAVLMSGEFSELSHPGLWSLAWLLMGLMTLAIWSLTLFPYETWRSAAQQGWPGVACGAVVGSIAWMSSFLTIELWRPLAAYTFTPVKWILGFIYSQTVIDQPRLIVGTPKFRVIISPECSGYEGIGLILAFLTVYVWLSRKSMRFPQALILFPLGAAAIWIVNIFRIVALIAVGTSGWPAVAKGGFHSQAGWVGFSAVALGLVALTSRRGYFMRPAETAPAAVAEPNPTAAYLVPFLTIVASAMITGAFSAGFDQLYPVRVLAAAVAIWIFRKSYADVKWSWSWPATMIGAVAFVIWIAMTPAAVNDKAGWPSALQAMPFGLSAAWLLIRVVGYVVTVPVAEELAFRGFLTRRLIQTDFQHLPSGTFSWFSFVISSVLFGALHGSFWLAGTIAGLLFALSLYRRGRVGDAIQAHATTNALIAIYVLITGRWSVWS
jgi:exosortase E/protease (VPEID-CTERM system)